MLPTEKCFNGCELEVGLSHISLLHKIAVFLSHVRGMDEPLRAPRSGSIEGGGWGVWGPQNLGLEEFSRKLESRARKWGAVLWLSSWVGNILVERVLYHIFLPRVRCQMMPTCTDFEKGKQSGFSIRAPSPEPLC